MKCCGKLLFLVMMLASYRVAAQHYNRYWPKCIVADSLCKAGNHKQALDSLAGCFIGCTKCKTRYAQDGCLQMIRVKQDGNNNHDIGKKQAKQHSEEEKFTIKSFVGESVLEKEAVQIEDDYPAIKDTVMSAGTPDVAVRTDTVTETYWRTDTLLFTDNSHLVHPYFIKSWRMEKKAWRWTFNGIGLAAVGGSIGLGVEAARNYRLHEGNTAPTRREHERYYRDYRLYSGLMGGCITLAVVTLSANILAVQVRNDVKIVPGVWVDRQGNVQASVTVKF